MNKAINGHLLSFVLVVVLVWYTAVVPVSRFSNARGSGGNSSDAGQEDAELPRVRDAASAGGGGGKNLTATTTTRAETEAIDEMEWPEIIGDEQI